MTEKKAHDTPPEGPPVRFETRDAGGGRRVGIAWLARPRRLNALDLDMCELLLAQLGAWAVDDAVAAVVVAGDGPKGFCAGGDVARIAREIRQGGPDACAYGDRFFTVEYQLDYLMHAYAKPLVTWAHGVTMGGGLGLSVAGSNRIVTTGSRIAMPEIHIGLFPDVGGGWFLNRVPGEAGILLALTGVVLNEQDAVYARFADHVADHERQAEFLDALCAVEWGDTVADHRAQATHFCRSFEAEHPVERAPSALREKHDAIRSICTRAKLSGIVKGLREAAAADDWFAHPLANLTEGSPTAAAVTLEYLRRCRLLGLQQVLELDRVVAMQCLRHHDFPEGVRALLIDKDKSPRWSPASAAEVTPELVAEFFEPVAAGQVCPG
jgi:enoyl-CoA hydratase/carnithine racemase